MRAHRTYEGMVACSADLDADDTEMLRRHLRTCESCRRDAEVFGKQSRLLRAAQYGMPPAHVRATVLGTAAELPGERRTQRTRGWRLKAGVAALIPLAIAVNTPLPRAVGGVLGLTHSEQTKPPPGFVCLPDGAAIPRWYHVLSSPGQYDLGPHGSLNPGAINMVRTQIPHPTWYVNEGGGDEASLCRSAGSVVTIQVGFNPDTGTELYAVGMKAP